VAWPQGCRERAGHPEGVLIGFTDHPTLATCEIDTFRYRVLHVAARITRAARQTHAGFTVSNKQLLDEHYVRTLDMWASALEEHREDAVAATSVEVYDRYMKYLVGCSDFFQRGVSELGQFTLVKG